jgi:hypothetical protein
MGWLLALLHPDVFTCYMAMSVPYGRGRRGGALTAHRKAFGDERKPETDPNFFYQLHHAIPGSEADFNGHTREALMTVFGDMKGPCDPPLITSSKMFVDGKAEPSWRRGPQPKTLVPFVTAAEFEYFVGEYERAGWHGGLNWYRVLDDVRSAPSHSQTCHPIELARVYTGRLCTAMAVRNHTLTRTPFALRTTELGAHTGASGEEAGSADRIHRRGRRLCHELLWRAGEGRSAHGSNWRAVRFREDL